MANYDLLGNIVLVKFKRGTSSKEKKVFANKLLSHYTNVRTVLEKTGKFKGRLRTHTVRWVAGEKTRESLYKENGCVFRFNVETCYFSPRLAHERLELANMMKKGESVLVMFGGVAPFAVVLAKLSNVRKMVSVELSRACLPYAQENVKRNKLQDRVTVLQGDVRRVVPRLHEKFDRIVMGRPNLKDPFLDVAFPYVKKGGIIYYYGFCAEDKIREMRDMVLIEAKKARKKVRILKVKKAGDIGVREYRWRIDIKVI
jgi:tRNA (guanine37-N1)-methyltransferase